MPFYGATIAAFAIWIVWLVLDHYGALSGARLRLVFCTEIGLVILAAFFAWLAYPVAAIQTAIQHQRGRMGILDKPGDDPHEF